MTKPKKTRKPHPLLKTILWLVPPIYKAYMTFVFLTSKRIYYNFDPIKKVRDDGTSVIGAIWHQDVILLPFTFRNYNVVTMVSMSDLGEVMAPVVRKMGFTPVRGGSSMGGSEALSNVIDYIRSHRKIFFGITVDGSRGPRYVAKKGVLVVAKESGAPIFPNRGTAKRKILIPSWDRTLVPLPFNTFVYFCGDPVYVPADATMEDIETKRKELEDGLMKLVKRSDEYFKNDPPIEHPHESKTILYGTRTEQ